MSEFTFHLEQGMAVLHDLYCPECDIIYEDQLVDMADPLPLCPFCSNHLAISFLHWRSHGRDWFKPGYWEHLYKEGRGPWIDSKEMLKREAEKQGSYCRCLLEEVSSGKLKQEISPTRRPAVEREKRRRQLENDLVETAQRMRLFR